MSKYPIPCFAPTRSSELFTAALIATISSSKIRFDNLRRNPAWVVSAEISYLEPGPFETKSVDYQPEDMAFVKSLITNIYARIMRQEVCEGCGQGDCSWCRFCSTNNRWIALWM